MKCCQNLTLKLCFYISRQKHPNPVNWKLESYLLFCRFNIIHYYYSCYSAFAVVTYGWWVGRGVLIIKSGLTPSSLKLMLTRLLYIILLFLISTRVIVFVTAKNKIEKITELYLIILLSRKRSAKICCRELCC